MSTLADLTVKIGANTKAFDNSLKRTKKKTTAFRSALNKLSAIKMPLIAAAAAVTGLGLMAKRAIDSADAMDKLALKTGLSVETLGALDLVAKLGGGSIDTMEKGMKRMSSTIVDAGTGMKEATDALDLLGVSVDDLQGKTPEEQFFILTEALAGIEDPTLKAAAAQDIFGRAGVDIIPMLGELAKGSDAVKEAAAKLGPVLTTEGAASAAAFNDSLTKLSTGFGGFTNLLFNSGVLDFFTNFVDRITGLVSTFGEVGSGTETFAATWDAVWTRVKETASGLFDSLSTIWASIDTFLTDNWEGIVTTATVLWESVGAIIDGVLTAIGPIVSGSLEVIGGIFTAFGAAVTGNWTGLWDGIKAIIGGVWEAILGILDGAIIAVAGTLESLFKAIDKITGTNIAEFFGDVKTSIEKAREKTKKFKEITEKTEKPVEKLRTALDDAAKAADGSKGFAPSITAAKKELDKFDLKKAITQAGDYETALKDLKQKAVDDLAKIAVPDLTESMRLATSQTEFLDTAAVNLAIGLGTALKPAISDATLASVQLENAFGALGVKSQALKEQELKKLREAVDTIKAAMDGSEESTIDFKNAQEALQNAIDGPSGSAEAVGNLTINIGNLGSKITDDLMGLLKGEGSIGDVGKAAFNALSTAVLDFAGAAVLGLLQGELTKTLDLFTGLGSAASKMFGTGASVAGDVVVSGAPGATTGGGAPSGGGGGGLPRVGGALPVIDTISGVVTAVSSVVANFQFRRMNKLLDLIEKSTRFSWITLGGRTDGGIIGVLFGIKESIDWGNNTKANEETRDMIQAGGLLYINPSLDAMKDRLLTLIGAVENLGKDIKSQPIEVSVEVSVAETGRVSGTISGRGRDGVVEVVKKAIKLNTSGLRGRIQVLNPI